jgi:hypothetical protein
LPHSVKPKNFWYCFLSSLPLLAIFLHCRVHLHEVEQSIRHIKELWTCADPKVWHSSTGPCRSLTFIHHQFFAGFLSLAESQDIGQRSVCFRWLTFVLLFFERPLFATFSAMETFSYAWATANPTKLSSGTFSPVVRFNIDSFMFFCSHRSYKANRKFGQIKHAIFTSIESFKEFLAT